MPTGVYPRTEQYKKERSKSQLKIWENEGYKKHQSKVHKGQKVWQTGLTKEMDSRIKAPSTAFKRGVYQGYGFKAGHIPLNKGYKAYSFICPSCKKNFETSDKRRKYCSDECRYKEPWNKNKKGVQTSNKKGKHFEEIYGNRAEKIRDKIKIARLHQVFPTKDSLPEIMMQTELINRNIQFQKHLPIIGQPDIVIEPNICVFADGDYWHNIPKQIERDKKVNDFLINEGFIVLRYWEHQIKENVKWCVDNIESYFKKI